MHILEIPSFFPPSGGLFCLDQSKALAALGHEVRILSNVQLGVTIHKLDYLTLPFSRYEHVMDGITVYQSYQRGIPRMIHHNVNHWVGIVCSIYQDYERRYGRPDILHAHCAKWAGYAAMLLSQKYGIPYFITEHMSKLLFEEEFGPAPSNAWQIALLKQAYLHSKMVVPVSAELVDSIACYFGKQYRWQAISNTIDTEYFAYQERQPRQERPFRFCCIANYWSLKGYDVLFAAFNMLRHQGLDVELHLAGKGTDGRACKNSMSKGMTAHGVLNKSQVRNLLYACDALVLASRSEVQPLVLLEAMSTGIPVISTECIPQCLRIEGGCTIVPIDDSQLLAHAMQTVVQQPYSVGRQVSERVAAMASPQVVGRRLEQLFLECLK